jgi:hypothetical protein
MYPPSKLATSVFAKPRRAQQPFRVKLTSLLRNLKAPQQGDSKNTRCKRGSPLGFACIRSLEGLRMLR